MKLNNKGFAISSIMYIILILAVILISVTLAILSSRKLILDKIKKETTDNIYGISYNSVINTLKHEAISYASSNNIEQENIKIGDFETSVSQELLEHHELLDKYLTLYKNNYSYDVYLGQTKKVTDISKPIDNMLGIVDYKIEGNSYQATRSGKNLFNVNDFIETYTPYFASNPPTLKEFNGEEVLDIWGGVNADGRAIKYMEGIFKENTQYTFSFNIYDLPAENGVGANIRIYYTDGTNDYILNTNRQEKTWLNIKITSDINKTIDHIRISYDTGTGESYIKNFQIEEGTKATEYEEYGVSPSPEYPSEIKSVGDKTNNLLKFPYDYTSITDDGITFTVLNDGSIHVNGVQTEGLNIYSFYFDGNTQQYFSDLQVGNTYYIGLDSNSPPPKGCRYYVFVAIKNKDGSIRYSNDKFKLEEGDVVTHYQLRIFSEDGELREIDATIKPFIYEYKIPVTTRGKNLINAGTVEFVKATTIVLDKPLPAGTYTLSALVKSTDTDATWCEFQARTNSYTSTYALNKDNRSSKTFTVTDEIHTIALYASNSAINAENDTAIFTDIQIEKGSTATDYEPYVEPVTTNIYLDEPLRKIDIYSDNIEYINKQMIRKNKQATVPISKLNEENTDRFNLHTIINTTVQEHKFLPDSSEYPYSDDKYVMDISGSHYVLYGQNEFLHWFLAPTYAHLIAPTGTTISEFFTTNEAVYKNGWTFSYVLETPSQESIELPTIQTNMGSSVIEVDTSIAPSNVEFTIIEKIRKL